VNLSFAKPGLVLRPEQLVEGQERGVGNHGSAGLLASSAGRGWSGLAAELRRHSGVIAWRNTRPDTEICVDVHGGASVVTRQRDGITDRTVSERGTIWLSPAGGPDGVIEVSDPLPAILHIYLPPSQFSPKSAGEGSDPSAVASLRFESSFQDPLVAEMAHAITSELQRETSVGSILIETLASSLAARLVHRRAVAEKMGIEILAVAYLGTRQVNLRQKRSVKGPADLVIVAGPRTTAYELLSRREPNLSAHFLARGLLAFT
jgi:AraC family transcriptional regulator